MNKDIARKPLTEEQIERARSAAMLYPYSHANHTTLSLLDEIGRLRNCVPKTADGVAITSLLRAWFLDFCSRDPVTSIDVLAFTFPVRNGSVLISAKTEEGRELNLSPGQVYAMSASANAALDRIRQREEAGDE